MNKRSKLNFSGQAIYLGCVSKGKVSPVTAKLKCPLWKGKRYS